MEDLKLEFVSELNQLITRFSILKNEDIKRILIEMLKHYTNYDDDFVILNTSDKVDACVNTETAYKLTPEMERILDESLDEIELEERSTQTCKFFNNTEKIDSCSCKRCENNALNDMLDDIDRTYKNISYGIDEIGSFIGKWFDDIIE